MPCRFDGSVRRPPPGTSGGRTGGSNLPGKTRCVDEFLVDPRVMDLCEGHLGSVFELSICVLMNIFPGAERQRFHQVRSPLLITAARKLTPALHRTMAFGSRSRHARTGPGC